MPASLQGPVDIANAAFTRLGFKQRIGSFFDGSPAAKKILDIYGQTRDQLIREGNWPFAQRDELGTVIKQAPAGGYVPPNTWNNSFPPLPWTFEYQYPSDCLDVRAVKPSLVFVPNYDPRPYLFTIANDSGQRVILSNVAAAVVTYAGQVTDPTQWPPDFTEALIASLARRLAPVFSQDPNVLKLEAQDEQAETAVAERQQG